MIGRKGKVICCNLFLFTILLFSFVNGKIINEFNEVDCVGSSCQALIYSQPNFINVNGDWDVVNDNWQGLGCENGYEYCTQNGKSYLKSSLKSFVSSEKHNWKGKDYLLGLDGITMKNDDVIDLNNPNFLNDVEIIDNKIIYHMILGIDVVYEKLPYSIKQTIVLNEPIKLQGKFPKSLSYLLTNDYVIEQNMSSVGFLNNASLSGLYVYDKDYEFLEFVSLKELGEVNNWKQAEFVLGDWISDESLYPIYLDPSFVLEQGVAWDDSVRRTGFFPFAPSYAYFYTPNVIGAGVTHRCPDTSDLRAVLRSSIQFNLSSIPSNANIINVTLNYTIARDSGNITQNNLSFKYMNADALDYLVLGNLNILQYWTRMNNSGLAFAELNLTGTNKNIPKSLQLNSNANDKIEEKFLANSTGYFSIGMANYMEKGACNVVYPRLYSSEESNSTRRPLLIINYTQNPTINNIKKYALNGSQFTLGDDTQGSSVFNTNNLSDIEFVSLNFSITDGDGIANITLFYTANGSNYCSLGNKQSTFCYGYPNQNYQWIEFVNGSSTSTFDGTQGDRGDFIFLSWVGNSTTRNYTFLMDEHYNPNVFKWYSAQYNFSDVKFQDGVNQRIRFQKLLRIEVNSTAVPLDADNYKLDFRVEVTGNPIQPLEAWACNSTYSTGDFEIEPTCVLVAEKNVTQLGDNGGKFRGIFTNALITNLGDIKYVGLRSEQLGNNNYYALKTFKSLNPTWTQKWEYSPNQALSWFNLGDGYETELNLNWFSDGNLNFTQIIFMVATQDVNGNWYNQSLFNITWDINASINYPPVVNILSPVQNESINVSTQGFSFNWTVNDVNNDPFTTNITISNGTNSTVVGLRLNSSTFNYTFNNSYWNFGEGIYNISFEACENQTSDGFCGEDVHLIHLVSVLPVVDDEFGWEFSLIGGLLGLSLLLLFISRRLESEWLPLNIFLELTGLLFSLVALFVSVLIAEPNNNSVYSVVKTLFNVVVTAFIFMLGYRIVMIIQTIVTSVTEKKKI